MSLLATASEWKQESNNGNSQKKKRVSSIGKQDIPISSQPRQLPPLPHLEETDSDDDNNSYTAKNTRMHVSSNAITKFEGMDDYNSKTNQRVTQMLNKMTSVGAFNDGEGLADYTPVSSTSRSSYGQPARVDGMTTMASRVSDVLPSQLPKIVQPRPFPQPDYMPNVVQPHKYSNYHQVYNTKPSFPQRNVGNERLNMLEPTNDRIMEKLNYLIHLMEEQQMEKTNNVMEEFILYSLLGVFMIYTVDSFTRAGKYSR